MTFLQPALLAALPLAALPVIIHLIHLYRRRQVKWAAMMFLLTAQRMNKGLSRLRQILILAMRVAAVAAILFVITRPLSGGWLGILGGAPDTVMILLDRSASMEQINPLTGVSKRAAGLRNACGVGPRTVCGNYPPARHTQCRRRLCPQFGALPGRLRWRVRTKRENRGYSTAQRARRVGVRALSARLRRSHSRSSFFRRLGDRALKVATGW